ncbi:hypothetical protein PGT21_021325 [Puccinia graminis f. sp. tritici]|uniref:Uncharacterized protein n=1 Tax=Puccinia graminis f. sp. tritici TaxID=56615 RepID=A0A5B0QFR6_PUCGR|nr:hypothetical protein PGT21_021325 [Puccinia graminis f. sp. tritici]
MVLLIHDSLLIPSYFPRCHPLSPPRTPHVTPPTPVGPSTPPAAPKQVSHRRFCLWSAPNPASAPRCSPLFVASPQYTLNPRSAVGRDPRRPPMPEFPAVSFSEPCAFGLPFSAFPRLGKLDFPLMHGRFPQPACVASAPRAFRISAASIPHAPNKPAKALAKARSRHHTVGPADDPNGRALPTPPRERTAPVPAAPERAAAAPEPQLTVTMANRYNHSPGAAQCPPQGPIEWIRTPSIMFSSTHPMTTTPNTSQRSIQTPANSTNRRARSPSDPVSPRHQRQRRGDPQEELRDPFEDTDDSELELDPALDGARQSPNPEPASPLRRLLARFNLSHMPEETQRDFRLVSNKYHQPPPSDEPVNPPHITQLTKEDRQMAIYTAIIAAIDRRPHGPVDPETAAPILTRSEQVRTWTYSQHIKEIIRTTGRENIVSNELLAYAQDNHEQSLFRMVMAPEVLEEHFPPGFRSVEHDAVTHVHAAVRRQLKQVRHKLRNVLMTGIVPHGEPSLPNIPNIKNLSRLVWRHLFPIHEQSSNAIVDREVGGLLRIRIAYLRLATLVNYYAVGSRHISQWHQIDTRLRAHRALTNNFTNHWHRLLCAKDATLFGHEPALVDLNPTLITVPTVAEVNARIADTNAA